MLFVSFASAALLCGMLVFIILTAKALWEEARPSITFTYTMVMLIFGTGFFSHTFTIIKAFIKAIS